jgi:frataxin-like iron-binding protein CyaY
MTIDDKISTTKSQQIGLESFFPLSSEKKTSTIASVKTTTNTTILIRRRSANSDIWICNSCTLTGDKWFMEKHPCKQNVTNNFAKVAQRNMPL